MDARRPCKLAREGLLYTTCLNDAEWSVVATLLLAPAATGRPWRWSMPSVLDGILHVLRRSGAW